MCVEHVKSEQPKAGTKHAKKGAGRPARWKDVKPTPMVLPPPVPRLCTAEGCEAKHYARGLCQKHYDKSRRPKKQ